MKRLLTIVFFVLLVFFGFLAWWVNGTKPVDSNNKSRQVFVIRKGEGVREIGNKLKKENLIRDPVIFFLLVKKMNLDGRIQAGDFYLSPSMELEEIIKNLTHGTLDIWVTIPEGKRAEEVAAIISEIIPNSQPNWKVVFKRKEGYLFPDTYLIPKTATADSIVTIMTKNFEAKFAGVQNNTNLNKDQIIILASLIEREAKFAADRYMVSSVLMNRLRISMPLQIDATVQYALGYQKYEKTWWKEALTKQDLRIDSPYNTYLNVGLPPGPISNPGFEALNAAANPKKTNFLYYISDNKGYLHFAEDLEGHNANIRKFGL